MAQGSRPDRVGDQMRAEISDVIARELHDPGVGFITITRVRVTSDLQLARVFYTSLGDNDARRKTDQALRRASGFIRRQVGQRLRLRRIPDIQFVFDESIEQQDRIERLLQEIRDAQAASPVKPGNDDDEQQ